MWAFDCPRDQREKCHLYIVKGKLCRSLKIPGKIPSFSCPEQPNWLLVSQVETWPKQTRYVVPQGQGGRQGCLNGSGGTSGVSPRSRGASGVSDWLNKHSTDPRAPLTWSVNNLTFIRLLQLLISECQAAKKSCRSCLPFLLSDVDVDSHKRPSALLQLQLPLKTTKQLRFPLNIHIWRPKQHTRICISYHNLALLQISCLPVSEMYLDYILFS